MEWSEKWQMPFNASQCKVLHSGHNNTHAQYDLLGIRLRAPKRKKILSVAASSSRNSAMRLRRLVEARRYLDMSNVSLVSETKRLYYLCTTLWSGHIWSTQFSVYSLSLTKGISSMERVQIRATKLIPLIRSDTRVTPRV